MDKIAIHRRIKSANDKRKLTARPVFRMAVLFCCLLLAAGSLTGQEKRSIRIKYAELFKVDEKKAPGLRKLIGDVVLSHKGALMYCDSAYYYGSQNMFEAFSNVRINQGDTIELFADYIEYLGEKNLAKARDSVELIDDEINLTTDFLDYNTESSNGYYYNGGKVKTEETTLTSTKGYYYNQTDALHFKDC